MNGEKVVYLINGGGIIGYPSGSNKILSTKYESHHKIINFNKSKI